ncbi:MAG: hypothetical protein V3T14_08210, partial [Myxococcota bacterium]
QNRVARTLIQNAIDGFPLGDFGKEKTPTVDCSSNHPFLCLFHKDPASGDNSFVPSTGALATMCRSHSCILDANEQSEAQSNSKSSVNLPAIGVIPLALPGVATYSICNLDVPFVAEEFRDFRFLYSGPTRTFTRITEFLGQIVCVDGWSFQGWCACSPGTGAPINANSCYDHNTDNGDSCNSPRLPVSEPCVCVDAAASNLPCGALAESSCQLERDPNGLVIPCDASATQCSAGNFCGANSGGGVCHAGLGVLPDAVKTYSGQAGVGDCMGISIGSIKLVENPEDFGPDGLPCTADDTTPRTTGGATVLTTGTSLSTIFDALFQNGICVAGPNTNAHCTSEVDCGELGVCEGVVPQAIFNNIGENLNGIPASGGCAQIDTSDLSGYLLVTSFASPDATAAGDLTSSSQYFCK